MQQTPGPSQAASIAGTVVGLLDPTQAARLLSTPLSTLSFATFHPRTASAGTRKLSVHDELCSRKRVVIEVLPTGECFWRWVPRAKGVGNVADEGVWPRVVSICGTLVECSQEQWDIYKLDPEYDCVVYPEPQLTVITRRSTPVPAEPDLAEADHHKRHAEDSAHETHGPQTKKKRPVVIETVMEDDEDGSDLDSDEEAVEDMIIDDAMPGAWREKKNKAKETRQKMHQNRERRRKQSPEKKRDIQEIVDLSMIDLTIEDPPAQHPMPDPTSSQASTAYSQASSSSSTAYTSSATMPSATSSQASSQQSNGPDPAIRSAKRTTRADDDDDDDDSGRRAAGFKRARTGSPTAVLGGRRPLDRREERKRQEVKKLRATRKNNVISDRRARDSAFLESLRAAAQASMRTQAYSQPTSQPDGYSRSDHTPSASSQMDPYSRAQSQSQPPPEPAYPPPDPISLEEKIRRIAEMNAYEEARREQEAERLRVEQAAAEKRRKQEEQWAREQLRVERERREREAEAERRKQQQQEEELRRQREHARRQREERWAYGVWTTQRALERFRMLSDAFDSAKFTPNDPLTLLSVPWPVLHSPSTLSITDIDWGAVEAFFKAVRPHMRSQDYQTLVEKSLRRFHPDRWRARRVLQSVQDEELRACLEVAANTVAQALTPLWREVKST